MVHIKKKSLNFNLINFFLSKGILTAKKKKKESSPTPQFKKHRQLFNMLSSRVMRYLSFCDSQISQGILPFRFTDVVIYSRIIFIFYDSTIVLYVYTTLSLSIHLLLDI